MPETLAVYVDGFNLYYGLHDKTGCKHLWLDLVALARTLRPRSSLTKVRYFTAPVLNDPAALSRQSDYLAALAAHNAGLVEIVNGRYQSKRKKCRKCGNHWTEYEEKETDVPPSGPSRRRIGFLESAARDQLGTAFTEVDTVPSHSGDVPPDWPRVSPVRTSSTEMNRRRSDQHCDGGQDAR